LSLKLNESFNLVLRPKVVNFKYITYDYISLYMEAYQEKLQEKYAFFVASDFHAAMNSSFKFTLPKMQNEKLLKAGGFRLPKNHLLLNQLNHVLGQLISAGITKHLIDYGLWHIHRPCDDEIVDPRRILSFTDLEYGFASWLLACFVSFVCFVCEVLSVKLKREFIDVIELVDFLRVIRARMVSYHDTW
jgi:hypothetical protein